VIILDDWPSATDGNTKQGRRDIGQKKNTTKGFFDAWLGSIHVESKRLTIREINQNR